MRRRTSHKPDAYLPAWGYADLPEPKPLAWRNWASFVGPGIVMVGIQVGGGEWLYGPEVTARYGGSLMWIATVAIAAQVFYNLECGRYALYCGEPIMSGFLRSRPGPRFWMGAILLLNLSMLIPGLSTHGAATIAAMVLGRPPGIDDQGFVTTLAFICLGGVILPVLVGRKVYTTLQVVLTAKVVLVLSFCLFVGLFFVSWENWINVLSGFVKFGSVPIDGERGEKQVVNAFGYMFANGSFPTIAVSSVLMLGAFAGYAGGGGMSNSTYSNFVRDKGWGMGSLVGAIPSAIGGRNITLAHVGKVFPLSEENLRRWKGWWRYILTDQLVVWAPGCVLGMALPALISLQFASHSPLYNQAVRPGWAQAMLTADGVRHAPQFSPGTAHVFWLGTLFVGLMVFLPSQMAIVDDFSRRWTDILWTGSRRVRDTMHPESVKRVYYTILAGYTAWSFFCAWLFTRYSSPQLMTDIIANINNVAIGATALQLLWVNRNLLPPPLRPRWFSQAGLLFCGLFYLGLSGLVFALKIWPEIKQKLGP